MSDQLDLAKELTLAAIEKLRLKSNDSLSREEHNKMVAEEIGKVYKIIYNSVINARG